MGQARKRFSSSNFTLRQHSHLPASASDEERSAPGPPSRRRSALRRLHPLRRRARCGRAQRETLLGRGAPSRCRCSAALAPSRRRTSSMTCGAPHTTRRLRRSAGAHWFPMQRDADTDHFFWRARSASGATSWAPRSSSGRRGWRGIRRERRRCGRRGRCSRSGLSLPAGSSPRMASARRRGTSSTELRHM